MPLPGSIAARSFVGMKTGALSKMPGVSIRQGLQVTTQSASVERGIRSRHHGRRFAPTVITADDPGIYRSVPTSASRRRPFRHQSLRVERCRGNGLARPAGVMRANVTMDEKHGRFNVQLLGDVCADFDQCVATLATGARFGLVSMFDARQMIR